ncbi:hypothetical protein DPMN_120789 [Dreissena polymorpha]|uniref:Uncharacterized protein n=1 Tax=Dreissena polymorpha TaxID=45954 RepID=A0A9D4GP87_DREPO|nr:hypothetical protein DPMN_120789 [Dreissena polymorpha]
MEPWNDVIDTFYSSGIVSWYLVSQSTVDGGFGAWSAWGLCSPPTGNGLKTRTHLCDNPQPLYGGRNCLGNYTEQLPCCDSDCPGIYSAVSHDERTCIVYG